MTVREGSLEAPARQPLDWQNKSFYDKEDLYQELERIYDICHGCRRCVSSVSYTHLTLPTIYSV